VKLSVGISTVIENLEQVKEEVNQLVHLRKPKELQVEILVVVQDGEDRYSIFSLFEQWIDNLDLPAGFTIRSFYDSLRGLSRSRNKLLREFTGDWLHICDDDVVFYENYFDSLYKVLRFIQKKEEDVMFVTFKIGVGINCSDKRKYWGKPRWHTIWSVFHVSSVEILLNSRVKTTGVKFDERFGLGAKWNSGEENIFLVDLLKRGYKGVYVPLNLICIINVDRTKYMTFMSVFSKYKVFVRMYDEVVGTVVFGVFLMKTLLKVVL